MSGWPTVTREMVEMETTPIYDAMRELAIGEGFNPEKDVVIPPVTKRDKHRAGQLTGKVWQVLTEMAGNPTLQSMTVEGVVVRLRGSN